MRHLKAPFDLTGELLRRHKVMHKYIDGLKKRALQGIYDRDRKLAENLYALYLVPWLTATKYIDYGASIYEAEWDLLVVLDACRVDALRAVADEFQFITEIEAKKSLGSDSKEWLVNNFRMRYADEVQETGMVTANPWCHTVFSDEYDPLLWNSTRGAVIEKMRQLRYLVDRDLISQDEFAEYHCLFPDAMTEYGKSSSIPASVVTDRAIEMGRRIDHQRSIVHYLQPHKPYIHDVVSGRDIGDLEADPFGALREGEDPSRVWDSYLANLRYVLSEVDKLLTNFDAETAVITADHGEMFGRWGLYGHNPGIVASEMRTVPWVETTAIDEEVYRPETTETKTDDRGKVQEHLEALGYL
jgi:hypothetical protein